MAEMLLGALLFFFGAFSGILLMLFIAAARREADG